MIAADICSIIQINNIKFYIMKKINFSKLALLSVFFCIPFLAASAADIYVASTGDDDAGDGSQANPVATLGKAYQLINSQSGTIYVSGEIDGYTAGGSSNGDGVCPFLGNSYTLTVQGVEGTDPKIVGSNTRRMFRLRSDMVLILKDLTLSGTPTDTITGYNGGCIELGGGSLDADHVIFENFVSRGRQGTVMNCENGLSAANPLLSVKNCVFRNNTAINTSNNDGSGVVLRVYNNNVENSKYYFENCAFVNNAALYGTFSFRQGVALTNPAEYTFVNSTFTGNTNGNGNAGCITLMSDAQIANIINCTVKNNPTNGAIRATAAPTLNIYNSVLENNGGNDLNYNTVSPNLTIHNSLILAKRNVHDTVYVKPAEYTAAALNDFDAETNSFQPAAGSLALAYGHARYLAALEIDYDQLGMQRLFTDSLCEAGAIELDRIPPVIATEAADATVAYNAESNPAELEEWLETNGGAEATDASPIVWSNDFEEDHWEIAEDNSRSVLVTFTATDAAGNAATTAATFTIEAEIDDVPPVITTEAADATVAYNVATNPAELEEWLETNGGAEAIDANPIVWSNDFEEVNWETAEDNSRSVLVTFTVTDAAGNAATTAATFTIEAEPVGIVSPAAADVFQQGSRLVIRSDSRTVAGTLVAVSGQTVGTSAGNEISLAGIRSGLYILKVKTAGQTVNRKVVIK
jgi:hypothetical protein